MQTFGDRILSDEALVFGSIAFDYIMPVFPTLREEIPLKDGKIEFLNIALVSDSLIILPGGTAGNIVFGIGYLGGKATVHSVAGRDFMDTYGKRLKDFKIDLAVKIYKDYETAHAYMISDKNNEQIIIWQPNAIKFIDILDFGRLVIKKSQNYKIAIFAPGTAVSTLKGLRNTIKLNPNTKKIFDPGQMVMTYSKNQFFECIDLAEVIIMNEAEWFKSESFGISIKGLREKYPKKVFIETLGEKGSMFYTPDKVFQVGVAEPDRVVEVTGAGDAFRSGLIKGLLDGSSWEESAKMGASMASVCIESVGGQGYEKISNVKVYEKAKNVSIKYLE
jgi:adenosine kinase